MSVIELAIAENSGGNLRVDVLRSPAGEASAVVELNLDRISAQRAEMQQAILASSVSRRRLTSTTERVIREVGQELFKALLDSGDVAGRYRAALAVSSERGERLRVTLRVDTARLANLPWEAMYDGTAGVYVCRESPLVRHVPVGLASAPLSVEPPLRVLGVVSTPKGLPALDAFRERQQLAEALAGATQTGLVELHWAPEASWPALQSLLLDGPWHVLHFIGHGDFDAVHDEGVLGLTRADTGRVDLVGAARFVDLLRQAEPMPRLVVLNSCSGGAAGATDLFSGLAGALVRGGVRSVVAMQYEISDVAAVNFCRGFYSALAYGRGIDQALTSGRVAILGAGSDTLEWLTPVLYLRGDQVQLFSISPRSREAKATGGSSPLSAVTTTDSASAARLHDAEQPGPPATADVPADQDRPARGPREAASLPIGRLAHAMPDHGGTVNVVAFSAAGLLASGSSDQTVRLWDPGSGQSLRTLTGHPSEVLGVAFSPDGSVLATAGADMQVRLWDPVTGSSVLWTASENEKLSAVSFSPDGSLLAIAGQALIWLRHLESGDIHLTLRAGGSNCNIAFSADGRLLAGGREGVLQLWNTDTGELRRTLKLRPSFDRSPGTIAFSSDGRYLAAAGEGRAVRLWHVSNFNQYHDLKSELGWLDTAFRATALAFTPDSGYLAAGYQDGTMRLWDTRTHQLVQVLRAGNPPVVSMMFSPDQKILCAASGNHVQLWTYDQAGGGQARLTSPS